MKQKAAVLKRNKREMRRIQFWALESGIPEKKIIPSPLLVAGQVGRRL